MSADMNHVGKPVTVYARIDGGRHVVCGIVVFNRPADGINVGSGMACIFR